MSRACLVGLACERTHVPQTTDVWLKAAAAFPIRMLPAAGQSGVLSKLVEQATLY